MNNEAKRILEFWFYKNYGIDVFRKLRNKEKPWWFFPAPQIDVEIKEKFAATLEQSKPKDYLEWSGSARERLAYVLLVDQFPRHIFRSEAGAFSYDDEALEACLDGLERGFDKEFNAFEKYFFYLPLMHSENKYVQWLSKVHYDQLIGKFYYPPQVRKFITTFVYRHKEIIDRFDRYPHRNDALGRVSTAEEIEFLKEPMSSF